MTCMDDDLVADQVVGPSTETKGSRMSKNRTEMGNEANVRTQETKEEEEEEEDFMSDKFLNLDPNVQHHQPSTLAICTSSASSKVGVEPPRTYSELRKQKRLRSMAKVEQNNRKTKKRSRFELEMEAREIGLKKNLIQREDFERARLAVEAARGGQHPSEPTTGKGSGATDDELCKTANRHTNKALQMMIKMGFRPGQALGKVSGDQGMSSREERLPIKLQLKTTRSGIGLKDPSEIVSTLATTTDPLTHVSSQAQDQEAVDSKFDRAEFINHQRNRYDEIKIHKVLCKAIRTCEDLDLRHHRGRSRMCEEATEVVGKDDDDFWSTFLEFHQHHPELFQAQVPNPRACLAVHQKTVDELLREEAEEDDQQDDEVERNEEQSKNLSVKLQESSVWLRLDVQDRVMFTLHYLRQKYCYCIWCGCQFDSLDDLADQCPGLDEDDH